ncbi:hypothetical protein SUNI508_09363 [Seiridium unicorne]|uniref:C6 zinc finger domain protein n=1 Tax=Seiridium unicorne TaxID=138068 RepID=A0ABR2URF5_9PEZI
MTRVAPGLRSSTGRECDGYRRLVGALPSLDASASSTTNPLTTYHPRVTLSQDPVQARYHQFFVEKTISQLTTFFPDVIWSSIIPQVAYANSSIRHAIFALSWYHERFIRPAAGLGDEATFALPQYNVAIRGLIQCQQDSTPTGISLISCLIFICIEVLRGKQATAIHLFKYGRGIIQESRRSKTGGKSTRRKLLDSDGLSRSVEAAFLRLAIQVSMLVGDVDPDLSVEFVQAFEVSRRSPSRSFATTSEARDELIILTHNYLARDKQDSGKLQMYRDQLAQWSGLFQEHVAQNTSPPKSAATRRSIALLELNSLYLDFTLSCPCTVDPWDPMKWDTYDEELIEKMIQLAAVAVGLDPSESTKWKEHHVEPQFHMDIGVTPVLYNIIERCRVPRLRRIGIKVLRCATMQEGVWDGALTSRVAERIMLLEEAGLGEITSRAEIPRESRIRSVRVYMDRDKNEATVWYTGINQTLQESITW